MQRIFFEVLLRVMALLEKLFKRKVI